MLLLLAFYHLWLYKYIHGDRLPVVNTNVMNAKIACENSNFTLILKVKN